MSSKLVLFGGLGVKKEGIKHMKQNLVVILKVHVMCCWDAKSAVKILRHIISSKESYVLRIKINVSMQTYENIFIVSSIIEPLRRCLRKEIKLLLVIHDWVSKSIWL